MTRVDSDRGERTLFVNVRNVADAFVFFYSIVSFCIYLSILKTCEFVTGIVLTYLTDLEILCPGRGCSKYRYNDGTKRR